MVDECIVVLQVHCGGKFYILRGKHTRSVREREERVRMRYNG